MKQSLLIDTLRVLAITLVFIAHFGQILDLSAGRFFGIKNFYYVSLGGVGVSMFLVLSGVLAGLGWSHKQTPYFSYLYKKVLRIYPLYWMSVPISVVGYIIGMRAMEGDFPALFPNGVVVDVFGSLSGFYSWLGLWGGPYNNPSWFIALIMAMYAIFPLVYRLLRVQPHLVVLLFLGLSIFARYHIGQHGIPFLDSSFIDNVKGFFYRKYGFMPGRPGDWFPLCRLFEFSFGVYLAMVLPSKAWFAWSFGPKRLMSFLSEQSFALFLVHYPFLFLVLLLSDWGLPTAFAITLYIALMFSLAFLLNYFDARIPRQRLMLKKPV